MGLRRTHSHAPLAFIAAAMHVLEATSSWDQALIPQSNGHNAFVVSILDQVDRVSQHGVATFPFIQAFALNVMRACLKPDSPEQVIIPAIVFESAPAAAITATPSSTQPAAATVAATQDVRVEEDSASSVSPSPAPQRLPGATAADASNAAAVQPDASPVRHRVSPNTAEYKAAPPKFGSFDLWNASTADLAVAACDPVKSKKLFSQQSLSILHDRAVAGLVNHMLDKNISPNFPEIVRRRACFLASTAKYSGLWIYGSVGRDSDHLWMKPEVFCAAIKLRLGLPLASAPATCDRCRTAVSDIYGDHALSCMNGGYKGLIHTALREGLIAMAAKGGFHPRREARVFTDGSNDRLDVVLAMSKDYNNTWGIDVATVHALQPEALTHLTRFEHSAFATHYEKVKFKRYGAQVAGTDNLILQPFVVDSLGGFSTTAISVVHHIAPAFAANAELHRSVATRKLFHRLVSCVVSGYASMGAIRTTNVADATPVESMSPLFGVWAINNGM
jgi:hypothetical protein